MKYWFFTLFLLAYPVAPSVAESCSPTAQQAHVTEIYPTADILPENLLRFYIYFSKPMRPAETLSSIHLLDETGMKMDGVFLDNKFNLWSPDGTRLTLLFDPGRVKTGLVAHETMGRALSAGKHYTLALDTDLKDIDGCPMNATYKKEFQVTEADFNAPDFERWQINLPLAGTTDWLTLVLNGPHDHVSLAYRMRVINDIGEIVHGQIALSLNETEWQFKPSAPWQVADYKVRIDPTLEDIVGNRITGTFESPINDVGQGFAWLNFKIMEREKENE